MGSAQPVARSLRAAPRQRGFTLIEILIVIIILGLLATVALFSLGGSTVRRELEQQSRELLLVLQVASERAILDNSEIGVQVENNQVRFLYYVPREQSWEEFTQRPFKSQEWADTLAIALETESDPPRMPTNEENNERPDLVFFSSGETTPFRLSMSLAETPDYRFRIETDGLNPLQLLWPDEDNEVRLQ